MAPVFTTQHSRVNLDELLNIRAFDLSSVSKYSGKNFSDFSGLVEEHNEHNHDHQHDDSVHTVAIVEEGDVDLDAFRHWLGNFVWKDQQTADQFEIFRFKGVLSVRNEKQKYALQGVHELFDIEPAPIDWAENEKRVNKIVFIGRKLNQQTFTQSFVKLMKKQ